MPLLKALKRPRVPVFRTPHASQSLLPIAAWQDALRPGTWASTWDDPFPWHYVTEEEALDLPVIAGFMQITQSLLMQMPLHAYRLLGDGTQEALEAEPTVLLNPTPGDGRTFSDFIVEYMQDMV